MVWAAISAKGLSDICFVDGIMSSHSYKDTLKSFLVAKVNAWFKKYDVPVYAR